MYTTKEVLKPKVSSGVLWETAEAPPVAEAARRFRGSVPVSMPQRGWKLADTTVNLSAAIGRKLPAGGNQRKSQPPEADHKSYYAKRES